MAVSNITVSNLVVAPGVQQAYAQWTVDDPNVNGLPYLQLDRVELWASTATTVESATKVAEGVTFANYVYDGFEARYHWIRARDRSGQYSDFYPSGEGVVDSGAWQDFSPTIYAQTGTITSVTVTVARFFRLGPHITINLKFLITTNGTGGGNIRFTLPGPANSNYGQFYGRRNMSGGAALIGGVSVTYGYLELYDGSYPGADGAFFGVWGSYEGTTVFGGEG